MLASGKRYGGKTGKTNTGFLNIRYCQNHPLIISPCLSPGGATMNKRYCLPLLFWFGLVLILTSCSARDSESGVSGADAAYKYVAEGRGTWMGRLRGIDWDSTMAALAAAGFNMVFPNMCTGGAALYPSEFLPMISERNELKLCIEAAHKYGIEVHVWKINWYMSACPDSFTERMEKEGRVQYTYDGKRAYELDWELNRDWLCPSHPENRKLEFNSMLELVKKYDVDGVHFDYMRFGREPLCYCDNCRKNFEKETGIRTGIARTDLRRFKKRAEFLRRNAAANSSIRETEHGLKNLSASRRYCSLTHLFTNSATSRCHLLNRALLLGTTTRTFW